MMFIKTFHKLDKRSVKEAGGKGASLGEMTQAGIPVPPGFVVLASAFDQFLEETDLDSDIEAILKKVNHQDVNSVDKASNEIRDLILDAAMPKDLQKEILEHFKKLKAKFVAVRSSATAEDSKTASWAGELETYLNTTEKNLLANVKKCWSSLFTPRAIFYRFEKKLHNKPVSVAVVVQAMVQSEISGICFTVHPVTKDYNQMVIEAAIGLGEAIVGGQVTPDTYVVHKNDFSILDINVSEQAFYLKLNPKGGLIRANKRITKQKLTGKQIVEIAKICKKIEAHYKHPQDIEWAYYKGRFYITQSRPITTL
ncbi:MAG: PEP/pyruvate-binding domain-containing protein [Candidatus Doudnabacteria bacterium]|nr:PEP/pyruvate-binding domain-containing protein [Candidatus Doudnabacteria bacterium]